MFLPLLLFAAVCGVFAAPHPQQAALGYDQQRPYYGSQYQQQYPYNSGVYGSQYGQWGTDPYAPAAAVNPYGTGSVVDPYAGAATYGQQYGPGYGQGSQTFQQGYVCGAVCSTRLIACRIPCTNNPFTHRCAVCMGPRWDKCRECNFAIAGQHRP